MSQNIQSSADFSLPWDQTSVRSLSRPALVLGGLYLTLPFIMYFAPGVLAYWVIAAVFAIPAQNQWSQVMPRLSMGLATRALILLVLWIALSLLWSPVDVFGKALNLIAFAVFGASFVFAILGLTEADRLFVRNTTLLGFTLAALCIVVDIVASFGISKLLLGSDWAPNTENLSRSVAALVAISWPLLGVLAIGRSNLSVSQGTMVAGLALCALIFASLQLQGLISLLAFGIGGLTLLLVHWKPQLGLSLVGAVFVSYLIMAPTFHMLPLATALAEMPIQTPLAWEYRLQIWHSTALQIFEHPGIGLGFDGSQSLSEITLVMRGLERPAIPGHPHNLFLQIWLELGIVGVALMATLLIGILAFIWSKMRSPLQAGLLTAALVTYLIQAVLNFGTWEAWWIATAWITVGTCFFAPRRL